MQLYNRRFAKATQNPIKSTIIGIDGDEQTFSASPFDY